MPKPLKMPQKVWDAIQRWYSEAPEVNQRAARQLSEWGKHKPPTKQQKFDRTVAEHFKDPNVQHIHSWDKDAALNKLCEVVDDKTEKEDYFIERTNKHIGLVKKYCKKIVEYDKEKFKNLLTQCEKHDDSKLKEPEKTPYISITWRHKSDNYKSYKKPGLLSDKKENEATLHHITSNSHHPEYHSYYIEDVVDAMKNSKDRDDPKREIVDAHRMPDLDIAEMVADWCAMGEELGNSAKSWADKNVNIRWKFDDKQKKLIYELIDVCTKPNNIKQAKEYAPGIPNKEDYGNPTIGLNVNDLAEFILQRHHTIRNPTRAHYDLRIGVPGKTKGTYSWAVPKAQLPEVGEKRLVVQTPVHGHHYSNFTGVIGKGYGAGKVDMAQRGKALITSVSPNTINFSLTDSRVPIRYTLVKLKTDRATKDWLLIRRPLPGAIKGVGDKPVIKSIQAKDLDEAMSQAEDIQAKIDGAHQLISFGPKGIEAQSVNKSVKGEPITHTERLGLTGIAVPKELQGTVVRSETLGTQNGKALPFQQIGGLMNSSITGSLVNQRNQKINMLNALFDVVESQGKPAPKDYMERKKILETIAQTMGNKFIMPPSAKGLEGGRELVNKIETGKEPLTQEGVILRMPGDKTLKYKLRPETKVYFSGVFPGIGKRKNIGGVTYSFEPGGKSTGHIGTGFTDEELQDILNRQEEYKDRPMRIGHQGQFALTRLFRAPSFLGWEEKTANTKEAQMKPTIAAILAAIGTTVSPMKAIADLDPNSMAKVLNIVKQTEFPKGLETKMIGTNEYSKLPFEHLNRSWQHVHGIPVKRVPGYKHWWVRTPDWKESIKRQINDYHNEGLSMEEAFKTFSPEGNAAAKKIDLGKRMQVEWPMIKKNDITKLIDNPVPVALVDSKGKVKTKLNVELADTPDKRAKGLAKRKELPKDGGMLFNKSGSFWMKDCVIPLDILFLDKTGTVLDTQTMVLSEVPDWCLPTYISKVKGDALALEVNAGWTKQNNIQVGDKIILNNR